MHTFQCHTGTKAREYREGAPYGGSTRASVLAKGAVNSRLRQVEEVYVCMQLRGN